MLITTRNKTRLKIAIIGAIVAASLAMTPNAAMAAPLDRGGVTHPTDQTASGVSVTKMPDKAALRIASEETSSLKAADPTGFERRVDLI